VTKKQKIENILEFEIETADHETLIYYFKKYRLIELKKLTKIQLKDLENIYEIEE
jgi:hypothetical protein